jgi:polysaccharide export outer membrane protein
VLDAAGHTVTVIGAVERPGVLPLRGALRLVEAIAASGGPRTAASEGEIASLADLDAGRVVREGKALPISLGRAVRGEPGHDVWLRPGDVVVVPAATGERIRVLGEVRSPRVVPFRPGMRVTEAIALAGGTTQDADEADVRVLRGPLSAPHVYRADLRALFRGEAKDVELAKGDVVFVTEHWLASMGHVLQRLTPFLAATTVGIALKK